MKDLRPHYTRPISSITRKDCEQLISLALAEDAPAGDITSEAIFSPTAKGKAQIIAKQDGIICGLSLIPILLEIDREQGRGAITFTSNYIDGQEIKTKDVVAQLSGNLLSLLRLERVILNFLQYLSGISSKTAQAVQCAGQKAFVIDTRKTLPGFRHLAKYAVYCGGGTNHRIHLSDMVMIKDNHLSACKDIGAAIKAIRQSLPNSRIEIEVDSLTQLKALLNLDLKVDVILLDNMDMDQMQEAHTWVKSHFADKQRSKIPFLELSGNWTLTKLSEWRDKTSSSKMDDKIGISIGALTHSAAFLDLSMKIM